MFYSRALASPLLLVLATLGASPLGQAVHPLAPATSVSSGTESAAATSSTGAPYGVYWQLTDVQAVLPGTVLLARSARDDSRGTRSDDEFFKISRTGSNDVPEAALRAYRRAEKVMAAADPGCDISWTLLAAIGRVESNHGRFGGAQLGADGISRPEIRGPQLNGAGAFAAIPDSDKGVLDHDKVWDRAVGPMQFLPETWQAVARDGDGDKVMNPDDIDDSALGAAVYLCGVGGSLADPAGVARAAFRYNRSDYYVQLVMSFQTGYQTGVFAVPSPPPPPAPKTKAHAKAPKQVAAKPKHTAPVPAAPKPSTPAKPSAVPKPKPTPKPSPTPSAPKLERVDGTWQACGPAYCLGTTKLDLGPQAASAEQANADFDGDGSVETNDQEFSGLVGQNVALQVVRSGADFVVYVIGEDGFRNADGSFARVARSAASPAPSPAP